MQVADTVQSLRLYQMKHFVSYKFIILLNFFDYIIFRGVKDVFFWETMSFKLLNFVFWSCDSQFTDLSRLSYIMDLIQKCTETLKGYINEN